MNGSTTETVPTAGPARPLTGPGTVPGTRRTRDGARPATPGEPVRRRQQGQRGPTADCTADIAGGLTFDVRLPASVADKDPGLLLRRRPGPSGRSRRCGCP